MSDVVVLIPVLNRPANAARVVESIRATSDAEILFLCTQGDEEEIEACQQWALTTICPWPAGPGDYAKKINYGFAMRPEPLVFLGADDLEFTPDWTVAVETADHGYGVVGTDDQANPLVKRGRHSTHSVVRRDYIMKDGGTWFDGPGIVYHEGYDHQCVDNELVQAAMDRNQWAFCRRAVVRHLHPMYSRGAVVMDDTYRKALSQGARDRTKFLYRQRKARPRVR